MDTGPAVLAVRRIPGPGIVAIRAWIPGGARLEPTPSVAWLAGSLLGEGTLRRDRYRIATDAEARGARLRWFGGPEVHGAAADGLGEDWRILLEWVAELILEPAFDADRLDWLRRQGRAELFSLADEPDVRTAWTFLRQIYGDHSRGRPIQGTLESLDTATMAEVEEFHRDGLRRGIVLGVAGSVEESEVIEEVGRIFGSGDVRMEDSVPGPEPSPEPPGRVICGVPGRDQAQLRLGHLTVDRFHPDLVPLGVASVILGAGSGLAGRIPTVVREREGLAYSVSASAVAAPGSDPGHLSIALATSPETLDRAESLVREELRRLVDDGVDEEEVRDAVRYLTGREAFRRQTAAQWAGLLAERGYWGLPVDDENWVRERLEAVERYDVEAAIRRHVRLDELRVTTGLPE